MAHVPGAHPTPRHDGDEPVRITTAAANRAEEIAGRQRRYLVSMAIRTVCVVGAVVVGPGWLRWVLIAGAVLLPYVAVVLANTHDTRGDDFLLEGPTAGHELPPPEQRPGLGG